MKVDQKLFDAVVSLIESRFGKNSDEGAAGIYTGTGKIITSIAPETLNDGVSLCHEVGAYCEAYKLNEKIVASLCVHQGKDGKIIVLTPCGICQERLYFYGGDVQVGVPLKGDPSKWESKTLREVQPFYWRNIL